MNALAAAVDPIVAVSTAPGRGGVGIVRVSAGPRATLDALIEALCARPLAPRTASFGPFLDGQGQPLDQGLALHFPAPHSYTGESVLELQGHGGDVVLQLLVTRCLEAAAEIDPRTGRPRLAGLRLAQPGEFTQRAFLNDKLDLAQAEAVADLIEAGTATAARSAMRSLAGEFSSRIDALREQLVQLRMLVEATLDFPEEEIDFLTRADAAGKLSALADTLGRITASSRQGVILRDGMTVVLAGQPNVGKSSLLNALAGSEVAIVTPVAGTTRDRVSQTLQIEGVPVHVIDTAGLREAQDVVERIGVERSWQAIAQADTVLLVHDLTRWLEPDYLGAQVQIVEQLRAAGVRDEQILLVYNKVDAAPLPASMAPKSGILLSARTGQGLEALRAELLRRVGWHPGSEGVLIARQRHVHALTRAQAHVGAAQTLLAEGDAALELLAEELRLAHVALGEITGAFSADDLLGEIFSRFCIGK